MARLTNSGYIHATERCPECGCETSTWYPVKDGEITSMCGVCPECGRHVAPCSLCASTGYDCRKCVCADMFEMHRDTEVYDKPNGRLISRRSVKQGYVDLGLPSGTLWAECNFGADKPDKNGEDYTWEEAKELAEKLECQLPTKEQFQELLDNCTWLPLDLKRSHDYKIIGPNGNCIILKAAGYSLYRDDGHFDSSFGNCGSYWSSSPSIEDDKFATILSFDAEGIEIFDRIASSRMHVKAVMNRQPKDESIDASANGHMVGTSDYMAHKVQPWDIVEMYGLDFFEGNMLKYLLRKKGDRVEDLKKIQHYVEKYIEVVERRVQKVLKETNDRAERINKPKN